VGLYPRYTGVKAHDNSISYESARNAGKMSLRRRMCLPGMALEQALNGRGGLCPLLGAEAYPGNL